MEDLSRKTAVIILAGGRGERLGPLTGHRAKPAVPFAGSFRIIDFMLSNCLHSGLHRIVVPVQYKCHSLENHIDQWKTKFILERGECLETVSPQGRTTSELEPYPGTAGAVCENLYSVARFKPKIDLILAGDHVYRMDYNDLISFHLEKQAELTIAVLETNDRESASRSGVLIVNEDGRIIGFEEKPKNPKPVPGRPDTYLISMGIYAFGHGVMVEELAQDSQDPQSKHDFGKNIIPKMVRQQSRVFAYPFSGYWRDIGTIDAYYEAQMDLVSTVPEFNLYDESWPWLTFGKKRFSSKFVFDERIKHSIVSEGCIIDRGEIQGSILSPGVRVGMDAQIIDSIIMDDVTVGPGARIIRAIVDKKNHIPPASVIEAGNIRIEGQQKEKIVITNSGIVVVPRYFEPGEEVQQC